MKLTKPISFLLLTSLCMTAFCCGCSDTKQTRRSDNDDDKPVVTELPEDEVLIIEDHKNSAWNRYSYMSFVMSDGRIYCSEEVFEGYPDYEMPGITDEERIALLQKYTKPRARIDEKNLLKIYQNAVRIDPDASFKYDDLVAYDAGITYVKVSVDGRWITISESGERNGTLDDRYARKADTLINGAFRSVEYLGDAAHVYSGTETYINTFLCANPDVKNKRLIITNTDDLRAFEKETGVKLTDNDSFQYFGDSEWDAFNGMCLGVEIVHYDEYLSLDEVSPEAFIISEDYVGFAFLEDPGKDISEQPVEQKCYFHIVQLPNGDTSIYDAFLNGN